MEIIYLPKAAEDLLFWKKSGNRQVQQRISALVESIQQNPFEGIGKPEPLKYNFSGMWSRRINIEHRLIYEAAGDTVFIHSLKDHY